MNCLKEAKVISELADITFMDHSNDKEVSFAEQTKLGEAFVDQMLDQDNSPFTGGGLSVSADNKFVIDLYTPNSEAPTVPETVAGMKVIVYTNCVSEAH